MLEVALSDASTTNGNANRLDHDGDGRVFVVIKDPQALAELAAWDWKILRLSVLQQLNGGAEDPITKAWEHDIKKLQWGSIKSTTLGDLVGLTSRSITNQTLHIGSAYNHAHAALVMADLFGSQEMGVKAFSLMIGHYEEQLAGLDETYYKFYENVKNRYNPDTLSMLFQLNKEMGHTTDDFNTFFKVDEWLQTATRFKVGKSELPDFAISGGQPNWFAVTVLYSIVVYRAMSSGNLGESLIKELTKHQTENAIEVRKQLQKLRGRSVVAEQIMLMLENVMDHVSPMSFPSDDDFYLEV